MTGLCRACGTVLEPGRRSPYCERCWIVHQRERRRDNVRAYRKRQSQDGNLPTDEEITWLDGLNLGLVEPIRAVLELVTAGRTHDDPEVLDRARDALNLYDAQRGEFDSRAIQQPDPHGLAAAWRGIFEELRGALR